MHRSIRLYLFLPLFLIILYGCAHAQISISDIPIGSGKEWYRDARILFTKDDYRDYKEWKLSSGGIGNLFDNNPNTDWIFPEEQVIKFTSVHTGERMCMRWFNITFLKQENVERIEFYASNTENTVIPVHFYAEILYLDSDKLGPGQILPISSFLRRDQDIHYLDIEEKLFYPDLKIRAIRIWSDQCFPDGHSMGFSEIKMKYSSGNKYKPRKTLEQLKKLFYDENVIIIGVDSKAYKSEDSWYVNTDRANNLILQDLFLRDLMFYGLQGSEYAEDLVLREYRYITLHNTPENGYIFGLKEWYLQTKYGDGYKK